MIDLGERLAARAVSDMRDGIKTLTVAALQLPEKSSSRAYLTGLVSQLERLLPNIEKELRGERYVCRCCGAGSFSAFGPDETICGQCHNGIHHDHEPTAEVNAENVKQWGRPGKVIRSEASK